jgi:hypothetical protein
MVLKMYLEGCVKTLTELEAGALQAKGAITREKIWQTSVLAHLGSSTA